jgi:hypothetical protein
MGQVPQDHKDGGDLWAHTLTSIRDHASGLHIPTHPVERSSSPSDEGRTGSRWAVVILLAVVVFWFLGWHFATELFGMQRNAG